MKTSKENFLDAISNYQGILHKVSLIYFKTPADREDNFQEILFQLWRSWPSLKKKESIGSWVYRVSINTSINNLKKLRARENRPVVKDQPDLDKNALERMAENERSRGLLQAISRLNEVDRSLMLLYLEERSYAEMSEILGISLSNVGVRINRAKQALKQHLTHLNYGN